jgi:hypothetical protein
VARPVRGTGAGRAQVTLATRPLLLVGLHSLPHGAQGRHLAPRCREWTVVGGRRDAMHAGVKSTHAPLKVAQRGYGG